MIMNALEEKVKDINLRQPLIRELSADLETPITAYMKLANKNPSFLLESVTGGEHVARYSFIGINPQQAYVINKGRIDIYKNDHKKSIQLSSIQNPLDILRDELKNLSSHHQIRGLPRFSGGLVGYLSYEMMRYFEPSVQLTPHPVIPDGIFLLTETLIVFDHAFRKMILISFPDPEIDKSTSILTAERRLDDIEQLLALPLQNLPQQKLSSVAKFEPNISKEQFTKSVRQAKEFIAAGDIFQVVLSQRLTGYSDADPFAIYRALRRLNPSPYMFYFNFAHLTGEKPLILIGASPEMHVRLENQVATVRPIAGTRPRGKDSHEDMALEKELLADPKERAEHVMLVDLARNDLGRVCDYGSVHVPEQMIVERYSHVMHIVSQVEGRLRVEYDAFDLLKATFPAGTVSGAPKIRAMQIISDLEQTPRGPYAGVVGYISTSGTMDTCITLRTIIMHGNEISVQSGAGIVADSIEENEYEETLNKARALVKAVELAETDLR